MSKPTHMPWLSPYLVVENLEKTAPFYQKAFGFILTDEVSKDEAGNIKHCAMTHKDQILMFGSAASCSMGPIASPAQSGQTCPMSLYLYTDNVDEFYKNALANGAKTIMEPSLMPWGDKMCRLGDPDGYHWSFASLAS